MACIKYLPFLMCFGLSARAQTFAEWFSQKSTQKKYLAEQIIALQTYRTEIKAGYKVASHGLGTIGTYNTSEYQLHDTYYTSLKSASASVKNNPQIKAIISYQTDITKQLAQLPQDSYYAQVKAAVLKDCDAQLAQLQKIVSDNQTQMTDADRLKAINIIHKNMLENKRFSYVFVAQALLLQQDKTRQAGNVSFLKQAYETH